MTNKQFFLSRWKAEVPATAACIRALPDDKLEYTPNPKTRTARELVGHIIGHSEDLIEGIETGKVNHRITVPFNSISEAAAHYEKVNETLSAKVEAVSDKDWDEKIVDFYINGNKIFDSKMGEEFWYFLFDLIHHRGQLSTYIRPMGGKNPSIYGPTADGMQG